MRTETLSHSAMMDIYYKTPADYDAVVQLFGESYSSKMLLVDPVFDETQMQYIFIIVL